MNDFHKRQSDPQIEALIEEVKGFREDMKPIQEFMRNVDTAKMASIWIVGLFAAIGATISWILNVKEHVKH